MPGGVALKPEVGRLRPQFTPDVDLLPPFNTHIYRVSNIIIELGIEIRFVIKEEEVEK